MKPFVYQRAEGLDDALAALGADARPYAGGTDLVPGMRQQVF